MAGGLVADLDDTFHVRTRLGIMTLLLSAGEADFKTLQSHLGATDGNLGAHIGVLENAGYIKVQKGFVGRKPRTVCKATVEGRRAFKTYLKHLASVIELAGGSAGSSRV